MDDRKKQLELFAKQLSEGNPLSEEFLPELEDSLTKKYPNRLAEMRALKARNLSEEALAHQVLKNTGITIPSDFNNRSKTEDFFNRIIKERYPEIEPNAIIPDGNSKSIQNLHGYFQPETDKLKQHIAINPKIIDKSNPQKSIATVLHEAGHQYDDNILGYKDIPDSDLSPKNIFSSTPTNKLITDIDPTQAYELMSKGHHANIPKLREGSFGLGALKSMLKSGTFKALPIVGAAATGYAALQAPDVSAAVADNVIPGGLESLGPSEEDKAIENPQANPDIRRQMLERIKNGR